MKGNFKRNLFISSSISVCILIVSSVASLVSIRSLLDSNWWVNHTYEVIYNLNASKAEMVDAQTSVRGFLLTGKKKFLTQYNDSEKRTDVFFNKTEELITDNPEQQAKINELKLLKVAFYKYLEERVEEKMQNAPTFANDLDKGKEIMDKMRTVFSNMENKEKVLLEKRTSTANNYSSYSLILITVAALVAIIISIVFFVRMMRDYSERAKLHQQLEENDRQTAERIKVIGSIAGEVASGNYNIRIDDAESDALGSVANSLNNMAHALGDSFQLLSDKEWLQAGIAELNKVMIGEKDLNELTQEIISSLAVYTNSSAGILYLLDTDGLSASAGYCYIPSEERSRLQIGQGLTGQAVMQGKILELKSMSYDDIKISFALGEVKPGHVVAVPLIDDIVTGVVELATVKSYSKLEIEFLSIASRNIAIAITAAQNRKRVQELLEETQAQSEELRMQHNELEGMNAELETQTEKLQASEEELRVQQEELQQTNEELAERSVLLEAKNVEVQKKSADLELSTRYKSEFLANMSHELRTPLNSILLLSRLLSENNNKNMNDEQIEFAKVIQSSGNGLLGLIDEILDLSKIEAGKMELEVLDVSINEVAEGLKKLFNEVAKAKHIEFNVILNHAPFMIKTDKTRLEQILKNLISNAIKFTAQGSVTLEIKSEADGRLVAFNVKDTGIGIPKEKQPLIFEAFQQADGSTKRKYGGTGLGLSISRELAKLLKGEITLKSIVDEGSEFILTIPVLGVSLQRTEEIAAPVETVKVEHPEDVEYENKYLSMAIPDSIPDDRNDIKDKDKVILIVEDDVNFAKSLLEFTRNRGYKGLVAVRGDHALNMALEYKPTGILLDIQLPVKSGWEVMEELKGNTQTRHIPVHIMSSHKLKQESLLKGAVNFLDKPLAFEQMPAIFKKIEHIINNDSQKVLIIEDNAQHAKALSYFLETHNINSEIKSEISEGVNALQKADVNCVILDMGIPDTQAYEILDSIKKNSGFENLPVIVFTGKSLSMQEELKIKKYADSIVIKTAHSYQRMLDEVSLFLHLVEENKNADVKKDGHKKANLLNNVLNNKNVLVVDDDVRNIYSITKSLEVLKMKVITAIDGNEALKALNEHPEVDIVLLDMMMPNMDGYETAKRIRENNKLQHLPVIAVTAKAMTGDREKCINAGASDYITKPVDIDQLLSLLRVWLYEKV